jgi:DNA polymerase III subunit delta
MSTGAVLVRGDDEVVVRDAVRSLVTDRLGDADRGLSLAEFTGDDVELATIIDAAQTPPFLSDRRVVVAWGLERFKVDELGPLLAYLREPLDTTALVLVWRGEGRLPKAVADAVAAGGGEVLRPGPGGGRSGRRDWLDQQLGRSAVKLDSSARRLVDEQLGEDLSRLPALLTTLESVHGPGVRLGADEVAPFLGQAGSVPPWELTDAIDKGEVTEAVTRVRRLLDAGERHPLQVMVTLTAHVERMLALSGSGARSEKDAAQLLGMKGSTYPARKALDQSRRLGPARVSRAVELLADADLALRGNSAWPADLVLEVLVARLAQLAR